jgi:hypothetical protein
VQLTRLSYWVHCESIIAVAESRGQFGNPERRGTSTVGSRYQRSSEEISEDSACAVVN